MTSDPDPSSQPRAYERPDADRPASAAPTEPVLEQELPVGSRHEGHDPYAALRFGAYRFYSLGWLINVVGHQVASTAIGWEIFDRTDSMLALGWVAGIQVIPLFLLALPAGQIADVFDRRRVIQLSLICSALCSVGLSLLSYRTGSVPWMFALIAANSAALVMGRPARSSLLPLVVPEKVFANAVAWNSSMFQIATVVGPAVGGLIIARSVRAAYAVDAGCALAFAAVLLAVKTHEQARSPKEKSKQLWRELIAGFRFVLDTKVIMATMTLDLFAVLLGGATYILPVFAKEILHVGAVGFGWLRAAEAIGAFLMTMTIAHLPPMRHAGRAMLLSVAGFGACTIVFGLSTNYALSFAMLFLIGALDSISVVVRHTLVQVLTPDAMRGRVSAVNNISIGASNELGGLESGVAAALFGPVISVVAGGIGTVLVVVGVAMAWPQVRRLRSLQGAAKQIEEERQAEPLAA